MRPVDRPRVHPVDESVRVAAGEHRAPRAGLRFASVKLTVGRPAPMWRQRGLGPARQPLGLRPTRVKNVSV